MVLGPPYNLGPWTLRAGNMGVYKGVFRGLYQEVFKGQYMGVFRGIYWVYMREELGSKRLGFGV